MCGQECASGSALSAHLRSHQISVQLRLKQGESLLVKSIPNPKRPLTRIFPCPKCDRSYSYPSGLQTHFTDKHDNPLAVPANPLSESLEKALEHDESKPMSENQLISLGQLIAAPQHEHIDDKLFEACLNIIEDNGICLLICRYCHYAIVATIGKEKEVIAHLKNHKLLWQSLIDPPSLNDIVDLFEKCPLNLPKDRELDRFFRPGNDRFQLYKPFKGIPFFNGLRCTACGYLARTRKIFNRHLCPLIYDDDGNEVEQPPRAHENCKVRIIN
jgi:hypothetical protein